ncbi:methyltransferase, cell division protein GidB [Lactiplantibacillus plantarum subsp. plantarum]|nr:methyltransferase, cell division protein GidB [Lactiplantibacillus plantarum subsp. plantarum]
MNPEEFKQALAQHEIALTAKQLAQFALYFQLLVTTNKQFNLTTITAEPEVYLKHFTIHSRQHSTFLRCVINRSRFVMLALEPVSRRFRSKLRSHSYK